MSCLLQSHSSSGRIPRSEVSPAILVLPQPLEVPALQQILTDGGMQSHMLLVGSVVLVLLATELTGVISSFCERNKDKGQEGRQQPSHTTPSLFLQRNFSGVTNIPPACGTCLPWNPHILFPRKEQFKTGGWTMHKKSNRTE